MIKGRDYHFFKRSLRKPLVFVISALLILGTFFSTFGFVPPIKTAHAAVATYYVRADGTVTCANKTNATSAAAAATSLNMAQVNTCTFSAGDQILFSSAGGNYSVALTIPSGGSGVGSEITYAGVNGQTVTVSLAKATVLNTNSQSNIIVNNLTLKNTASDNTIYLITVPGGSNITLSNLSVDGGFYTSGLKIYGSSSNINVNTLVGNHLGSAMPVTVTDTASSVTFTSCNMQRGFYVGSNAHDITFQNNSANSATGAYGSGFTISGSVYNVTFTNNISHDNAGTGFQEDTSANNITHTGDLSYNNTDLGFDALNNTYNITYNKCIAHNNGYYALSSNGLGFGPHNAATNIVVKNSLSYNNKNGGFADVSTGTNYFYNNVSYQDGYIVGDTFVGGTGSQTVTVGAVYGPFYFVKTGGLVTAKNNIIYQGKPWSLRYSNISYIALDYNDYHPLNSNNFYTTNGTNIYSWATYHTTNGYEPHSLNADPQFVNPGTDFHLQSTSSAIDAGFDTSIATDYAGKQRYDDPDVANTGSGALAYYDIGAYEYVTPPNPVLQSTACPSQTTYCYDTTPDITVTNTSSTTTYRYLVDQTLAPNIAAVKAGTADADGAFTIPDGLIHAHATFYIHVIAQNLDGDFSTNYTTYKIISRDPSGSGGVGEMTTEIIPTSTAVDPAVITELPQTGADLY